MGDGRRGAGEGSIYRRSDGRYFYAVDLGWSAGKRQRRTVSASTLKALHLKRRKLDDELRAGLKADGTMTVARWLEVWLDDVAAVSVRPRTLVGYRSYVDTHLSPQLGKHRLKDLRPDHVRALYRHMQAQGKSAATIRQAHAILSRALKVAEADGKIIKSPTASVSPPGGERGSHGKLTLEEAVKVLAILPGRPDAARWYAALLLGLRQGEALGLDWAQVDLDEGLLHVTQSQTLDAKGKIALGPVKSKSSRRTLPLLPEVALPLSQMPTPHKGLVWGPRQPASDYGAWQALLAEAGVPKRPLHAARATTASLLSEAGVPPKIIAEILGHSQVQVTEAHYIHGDESVHRDALGRLTTLTRPAIAATSADPPDA